MQLGDSFGTRPVTKPSALKTPWLSNASQHHQNIHDTWPPARLNDRIKLCTSQRFKIQEAQDFLRRASEQHISCKALNSIQLRVNAIARQQQKHIVKSERSRTRVKTFWLVLPYAPAHKLAGLGPRILAFFACDLVQSFLKQLYNKECIVRVSWRNQQRPIASYLKYSFANSS